MSYEAKYIEMMEEKTELFRALQTKKDQLRKLDEEIRELRSLQMEPKVTKKSKSQPTQVRDDESDEPDPGTNTHNSNSSRDVEHEEVPRSLNIQSARVFDFEETGVDQNELVPWTTILKETHGTGTLSSMTKPQKDRVDEAVYEFLSLHMHPNDVTLCKVSLGKKEIAALPMSMRDAFEYWLDEQIDSGMLDKQNLVDRKKKNGDSPVTPRTVQVFPWIDIIQGEYPDFEVEDSQSFIPFIKQFLKDNHAQTHFIQSPNGYWCPGIPKSLIVKFIASFQYTFSGLIEKEAPQEYLDISNFIDDIHYASANENAPQVNFMTVKQNRQKSMRIEDVYKDLDDSEMVKILKMLMPSYNSTNKIVRKEIKESVRYFLLSKLGTEVRLNQCIVAASSNGNPFTTYGIPKDLYYDFRAWAIKELRRRFGNSQVGPQPWEQN